ncbi:MAG: undecaprenyldiphospho-muramoylpentapeptide beta-N-acetylglucosaminyltransferase [Gemmatimonadota bacterium]|nr:undecaprenyldiphospho-muramoylpentapeptide beta-N-acetylglucosaminyltransferase [Gemmatimonadota bacterium]
MVKVLITGGGTGGHLMPALAIAETLREIAPDVEPVLVGAKRGIEAKILPERDDFRYHLLPTRPIFRNRIWRNIPWVWWAPELLLLALKIVRKERPQAVVGTGGYASGPVLLAAKLLRIPYALQEQNAMPGITTRMLARSAKQIHLGFEGAGAFLHAGKNTKLHAFGNPVATKPIADADRIAARKSLGLGSDERVLFVMGGSQGALAINSAVSDALEAGLFGDAKILWSVGAGMWERYKHHDSNPQVTAKPFWQPVRTAYAAADLVVARAGAMTTAELCVCGLPSILIPLPSAAADHQTENAKALEEAGAALHLAQADLSPQVLARQVNSLLPDTDKLDSMAQQAQKLGQPDAVRRIVEAILSLVR